MTLPQTDPVKTQVAAHWNRRAAHFDADFGHSIRTPAERAAWDRILDLVLAGRGPGDALDVGCGTGFLALELAARGHRATGIDFAQAMLAEARGKAAAQGLSVHFAEGDAEAPPFPAESFDLVVCRHLLWTLPYPETALSAWVRLLRPGGRLAVIDGRSDPSASAALPTQENAHKSAEYRAIGDRLPFLGGRSREEIAQLFAAHGLRAIGSDPLRDLVAAQRARMIEEGLEPRTRQRYLVWGDAPG